MKNERRKKGKPVSFMMIFTDTNHVYNIYYYIIIIILQHHRVTMCLFVYVYILPPKAVIVNSHKTREFTNYENAVYTYIRTFET